MTATSLVNQVNAPTAIPVSLPLNAVRAQHMPQRNVSTYQGATPHCTQPMPGANWSAPYSVRPDASLPAQVWQPSDPMPPGYIPGPAAPHSTDPFSTQEPQLSTTATPACIMQQHTQQLHLHLPRPQAQQVQYMPTSSAAQAPPVSEPVPRWLQFKTADAFHAQQQAQLPPHTYPASAPKPKPFPAHGAEPPPRAPHANPLRNPSPAVFQADKAEQHAQWAPLTLPPARSSAEPFPPPGMEQQVSLAPYSFAAGLRGPQLVHVDPEPLARPAAQAQELGQRNCFNMSRACSVAHCMTEATWSCILHFAWPLHHACSRSHRRTRRRCAALQPNADLVQ